MISSTPSDPAAVLASAAGTAGDPAPAVRAETPEWSRATLVAFRAACATVVLPLHLLTFVQQFLFFEWLVEPVGKVVRPIASVEVDTTMSIGAFILKALTRDPASISDLARTYMRSPVMGTTCYFLGLGVAVLLVTLVWSVVDRRRRSYTSAYRYMRVHARYVAALVTIVYAMVKVVPTQFGYLTPADLLRPYGQQSPFFVLWNFMASSTMYTVFAGVVELTGAILLFFPRTVVLGALILVASMTNVVLLDVAFSVPSGALNIAVLVLVFAAILIAPYVGPLFAIIVRRQPGRVPDEPGRRAAARPMSIALKVAVIALVLAPRVSEGLQLQQPYFGGGHAIYGLFDVDTFIRNGTAVTPLATDGTVWKRFASDGRYDSGSIAVQFADGHLQRFAMAEDPSAATLTLKTLPRGETASTLRYSRDNDGIWLEGQLGADSVRMRLRPVDPKEFPLLAWTRVARPDAAR